MPTQRQTDPCLKVACIIQKCLQENRYQESACESVLQSMRLCCSKLGSIQSTSCSGFLKNDTNPQFENR
ncbi:hypothetical protein ScPMuIL_001849 [Solemya velum]